MTRSQNIALALGAATILATAALAACDSTTEVEPGPGGAGGSTATTSSTGGSGGDGGGTTSSTTSGTGGAGGFANACEEACHKIEVECDAGVTCEMINQLMPGLLDCSNPQALCPGQCIVDADCDAISQTFQGNIDPELGSCLQACQGGSGGGGGGSGSCLTCLPGSCVSELSDCYNDGSCQAFLQCAFQCADSSCVDGCLASNPSAAGQAVISCACGSCPQQCDQFCGAGSGGGGG